MPRYFFEIRQGDKITAKNEGLAFSNPEAAWIEATASFGEMIRDLDGALKPGAKWEMDVIDENQKVIFKLAFVTEAVVEQEARLIQNKSPNKEP